MTCDHRIVAGFRDIDGNGVPLWQCADCTMRFHPGDEVARIEAEARREALTEAAAECERLAVKAMTSDDECVAPTEYEDAILALRDRKEPT